MELFHQAVYRYELLDRQRRTKLNSGKPPSVYAVHSTPQQTSVNLDKTKAKIEQWNSSIRQCTAMYFWTDNEGQSLSVGNLRLCTQFILHPNKPASIWFKQKQRWWLLSAKKLEHQRKTRASGNTKIKITKFSFF